MMLGTINILAQVFGRVDEVTYIEAIKDKLHQISHQGFSGLIEFDANDKIGVAHALYQFNGTEFVPFDTDK